MTTSVNWSRIVIVASIIVVGEMNETHQVLETGLKQLWQNHNFFTAALYFPSIWKLGLWENEKNG